MLTVGEMSEAVSSGEATYVWLSPIATRKDSCSVEFDISNNYRDCFGDLLVVH